MFKSKIACVALYKVSTPFCVKKEASLVRAAARQKHQFYGERIKPQTSHANPKLKFTKVFKYLSQSCCIFLLTSESASKSQYFILNVECCCDLVLV